MCVWNTFLRRFFCNTCRFFFNLIFSFSLLSEVEVMTVTKNVDLKPKFMSNLLRPNRNLASFSFLVFVSLSSFIISKFLNTTHVIVEEKFKNYGRSPKYWHVCEANWNRNGHLRTMDRVFDRLGFEFVNASNGDDWDVLWGFEYPFDNESAMYDSLFDKPLLQHQRVNHIPGIFCLTNKMVLTTDNYDLDFILPTFDYYMESEFHEYVKRNPDSKFVEKSIWNRGVKVVEKDKIQFNSSDEMMYQVFMNEPMLIDERAFDIGVYVLISSVNPIRVYRYKDEMLMRFCPEPYYPFNASNVNQYVIYENHMHYSELPSFKKYDSKYGYSLKRIYEDFLEEKGYKPDEFWEQIDEIIATIVSRHDTFLNHQVWMTFTRRSSGFFKILL